MIPFISICIPAYQRPQYLQRLLDSIVEQTYRDYEVIVTDDSPDETVKHLCEQYKDRIPLHYYKNPTPLGTPANWNVAIKLAKGMWIKLMHDDDWFASPNALQQFAEAAQNNDGAFIFSAYCNVYGDTGRQSICFADKIRLNQLRKKPESIVSKNIIGHPSTTLHPNHRHFYDERLKWMVDIEFYIRELRHSRFHYINQVLVNIGMSDSQVTAQVKMHPEVEVPEHLYFLEKMGVEHLKNVFVYDYYWRFIRNFRITTNDFLTKYAPHNTPHPILTKMINFQRKIPYSLLKFGPISKFLMLLHYIFNKNHIKQQ